MLNRFIVLCGFFILLSCSHHKTIEEQNETDEPTVTVMTRKHADDNKGLKTGHLIMMVNAKLPFPKEALSKTQVIDLISQTDNVILESTETKILVEGFGVEKNTGKKIPVLVVRYDFENEIYVGGPILIEASELSDVDLTGKSSGN